MSNPAGGNGVKIHMVKQGDSLTAIAQKFEVPLEDLRRANPEFRQNELDAGMKVRIPSSSQPQGEVMHQHVVQQGDTLWKLSKAWGVPLSALIKANPQMQNPNALMVGQVVNIPSMGSGSYTAQSTAAPTVLPTGKKNTGVIPGTGNKTNTAPLPTPPVANVPVPPKPVPIPIPIPIPIPVKPAAEKEKPVEEKAEKSLVEGMSNKEAYPIMGTEDMANKMGDVHPMSMGPMGMGPMGMGNMGGYYDGVGGLGGLGGFGPMGGWYGDHGYSGYMQDDGSNPGMPNTGMVSPEMMNPNMGMVSPEMLNPNMGMVSPEMLNPNIGMVSPEMMNPNMGMVSPEMMMPKPCGCKGHETWTMPTSVQPNYPMPYNYPGMQPSQVSPMSVGNNQVSPLSMGNQMMPMSVSPASVSPQMMPMYPNYPMPNDNMAHIMSPYETYPGYYEGNTSYPVIQSMPNANMPHIMSSYEMPSANMVQPSMVQPNVGSNISPVEKENGWGDGDGYYGGIPPLPPLPPLRREGYDERSADFDGFEPYIASTPSKRSSKAKTAAAKKPKPKRKGSIPWVKA
jgi:morphogenetic protein associated with SpoVID